MEESLAALAEAAAGVEKQSADDALTTYREVVAEHGADSEEARAAQKELAHQQGAWLSAEEVRDRGGL